MPGRPGAERRGAYVRREGGAGRRRWRHGPQVEASDDGGEAYEVEVRAEDGEWDVDLDADYQVLGKKIDD